MLFETKRYDVSRTITKSEFKTKFHNQEEELGLFSVPVSTKVALIRQGISLQRWNIVYVKVETKHKYSVLK